MTLASLADFPLNIRFCVALVIKDFVFFHLHMVLLNH